MDERTPSDRRLILTQRRAERERLLRAARDATELQDAAPDYEDDEPSVVTFRGKAADLIAERQAGLVTRIQHSLAPISKRMGSPTGKVVAVLTGIGALITAALQAIAWMQEQGIIGP